MSKPSAPSSSTDQQTTGQADFEILAMFQTRSHLWEIVQAAKAKQNQLTTSGKQRIAQEVNTRLIKDLNAGSADPIFIVSECRFLIEDLSDNLKADLAEAAMNYYLSAIKRGQLKDLLGIEKLFEFLKIDEFSVSIEPTQLERWKLLLMHLPAEFWAKLSHVTYQHKITPNVQTALPTYHQLGAPRREALEQLKEVIAIAGVSMLKNGGAKSLARLQTIFDTDESGIGGREQFRANNVTEEAEKVRSKIRSELREANLIGEDEANETGPLPIRCHKNSRAFRQTEVISKKTSTSVTKITGEAIFRSCEDDTALDYDSFKDPDPELDEHVRIVARNLIQTYFPYTKVTDELVSSILEMQQIVLLLTGKNMQFAELTRDQKKAILAPLGLDENLKPVGQLGIAPKLLALTGGKK